MLYMCYEIVMAEKVSLRKTNEVISKCLADKASMNKRERSERQGINYVGEIDQHLLTID